MRDASPRRRIARLCRALLRTTHDLELAGQLQRWAVECDSEADGVLRGAVRAELLARAHRHRLRAEEYRAVRDQVQHPKARASYQRLAETYEAMARQLEEIADVSLAGKGKVG